MTTVTTRQTWIDAAKGIGIVLVVYGHVQRGLVHADVMAGGTVAAWADYALYLFHMPLFFFLAGLVAEKSLQKGTRAFFASKLQTIIYPYVLWSVIQGVVQWLVTHDATDLPTLDRLGGVTGLPIGQFWFLYALMLCHIVFAIGHKMLAGNRFALLGMGLLMLIFAAYAPERLATMLRHFIFYAGGVVLARGLVTWQVPRALWLLAVIVLFVIFAAAAGRYWGVATVNDVQAITGFIPLPAAVLGIGAVVWVAKILRGKAERVVVALGQMSMSIFVMHIIALGAVRAVLLKFGVDNTVLHIGIGMAAGVGLPVVAHLILQRLNMLHWAGLGRRFAGKSTI